MVAFFRWRCVVKKAKDMGAWAEFFSNLAGGNSPVSRVSFGFWPFPKENAVFSFVFTEIAVFLTGTRMMPAQTLAHQVVL